tara:strand:- start:2428 stop:2607 length:180 start_codon:yes stop_codon:yes gene_type:complete
MKSIKFTEFSKIYPNITAAIKEKKDVDSFNFRGVNLELIKIYSQRSLQTFLYLILKNKS